jgi:uncharacterized RDD family membrane protein YckC
MPLNTFETPSLKRRFASMLYEALLLFGVLFIAVFLFSTLLQQRHALYLRGALQDWLFLVVGIYFVWFWTHGGQTLPMKTWRIRLVRSDGQAVKTGRAIGRYLLAWLWFLPGLVLAWLIDARTWLLVLIPAANVALWALAIYLDPNRQFLHDRLAGTRLVRLTDNPPK